MLLGSMVVAIASILPQMMALVLTSPSDFGVFSIGYLLYALGISTSLSLVSEPWSRGTRRGLERMDGYASICCLIGLVVGAGAFIAAFAMGDSTQASLALSGAIALATVRSALRYVSVYRARWGRILRAELSGIASFALVLSAFLAEGGWILSSHLGIASAWACGALVSTILDWPVGRGGFGSPFSWISRHWGEAKLLLRDSVLMDIGAVAAPLVLVAPLGPAGFGIYRAVSNVAAPVRMLLDPVRATIGTKGVSLRDGRNRISRALYAGGILSGLVTWALLGVVRDLPFELGVLTSLADYTLPTALFVTANFLGHYAYIRCRHVATGRTLLKYRLVQTTLMFALPLLGLMVGGLGGAIWGLALAAVSSGIGWIMADSE